MSTNANQDDNLIVSLSTTKRKSEMFPTSGERSTCAIDRDELASKKIKRENLACDESTSYGESSSSHESLRHSLRYSDHDDCDSTVSDEPLSGGNSSESTYNVDSSAVKDTEPGKIYQIKLIMLCISRLLKNKIDFWIATEMNRVGVLDDIVYKYKDKTSGKICTRFIQAKHVKEKITKSNLLSLNKKANFSVIKYFLAFCKIKCGTIYESGTFGVIEELIICTISDFNFEIEKYDSYTDTVADDNVRELDKYLKEIDCSNDEILQIGNGMRKCKFFLTKDETDLLINNPSFKNKVMEFFNKTKKNIENDVLLKLENILKNKLLDYLHEFFEKFVYVTNTPNQNDLGKLIERELVKDYNTFPDAHLFYSKFYEAMHHWLASSKKSLNNERVAPYVTLQNGVKFFNSIKRRINSLIISHVTVSYIEKIINYGLILKANDLSCKLHKFLTENNFKYLTICSKDTRMTAIKVYNSITNEKLCKDGKYIFVDVNELNQHLQNIITNCFSSSKHFHLLIIEFSSEKKTDFGIQLLEKIKTTDKKIILIAKREDILAEKFDSSICKNEVDSGISFKDIKNQEDVLSTKKIRLQGVEVSLNKLFYAGLAENIIDNGTLSQLICDQDTKIMIGDAWNSGETDIYTGDSNTFYSGKYNEEYFIERDLYLKRIKVTSLNDIETDKRVFVTAGISADSLVNKFNVIRDDIKEIDMFEFRIKLKNDISSLIGKWIILPSLVISLEKLLQVIVEDIDLNKSQIYWFDHENYEFSFVKSVETPCNIENNVNTILNKIQSGGSNAHKKVVIVSNEPGAGKSTFVTWLAVIKLKEEKYQPLWTVRFNLKDYNKLLKDIDFNESQTEEAISFLSELINNNEQRDNFEKKIFQAGLKVRENSMNSGQIQNLRIAIVFDGFDEINPENKRNTVALINAVKHSNVAQIWVTTRPSEENYLMNKLECPIYGLYYLSVTEREELLCRYFKWHLKNLTGKCDAKGKNVGLHETFKLLHNLNSSLESKYCSQLCMGISRILECYEHQETLNIDQAQLCYDLSELQFIEYARMVLCNWSYTINESNMSFTKMPLNILLVGFVALQSGFEQKEMLTPVKSFEIFSKIKFDIYHQDKCKIQVTDENCRGQCSLSSYYLYKVHHDLSMKELNLTDTLPNFHSYQESLGKDIKAEDELTRVGLLIPAGEDLKFLHRSWAEYFVSDFINKNLESRNSNSELAQMILLERILIDEQFSLIRKFLEFLLKERFKDSTKFLVAGLKETIDLYRQKKDYPILDHATDEGLNMLVRVLLENCKNDDEKIKLIFLMKYKPLSEETYENRSDFTDNTSSSDENDDNPGISNRENPDPEEVYYFSDNVSEYRIGGCENVHTLQIAIDHGNCELVDIILNIIRNYSGNIRVIDMILHNVYTGGTLLYNVLRLCSPEIIMSLLNIVKDKGDDDQFKQFVLGKDKISVNIRPGQSVLHVAVSVENIKILKALLKGIKHDNELFQTLLELPDDFGRNPLDLACKIGKSDEIRVLLKKVKKRFVNENNIRRKLVLEYSRHNGKSLLDNAIVYGRFDMIWDFLEFINLNSNISWQEAFRDSLLLTSGDYDLSLSSNLHVVVITGRTDILRRIMDNELAIEKLRLLLEVNRDETTTSLYYFTTKRNLDFTQTTQFYSVNNVFSKSTNYESWNNFMKNLFAKYPHISFTDKWIKEHDKNVFDLKHTKSASYIGFFYLKPYKY